MIFKHYPDIREDTLIKKWPETVVSVWERDIIENQLNVKQGNMDEVERELIKFRKIILGLEKYRINNPKQMAYKYSEFIKTCLRVEECWGAAANAIQYAGLNIREHVLDTNPNPTLNLTSLWIKALDKLLDIPIYPTLELPSNSLPTTTNEHNNQMIHLDTSTSTSTWDQKYFTQMTLDKEGECLIQDMMMSLGRLAARAVLSRDEVDTVCLSYSTPGKLFRIP